MESLILQIIIKCIKLVYFHSSSINNNMETKQISIVAKFINKASDRLRSSTPITHQKSNLPKSSPNLITFTPINARVDIAKMQPVCEDALIEPIKNITFNTIKVI